MVDLGPHVQKNCNGINKLTEHCHQFACRPVARTCTEWKKRGLIDSVYAQISPSRQVTVKVFCDMKTPDGTTVIGNKFYKSTIIQYILSH